MAALRELVEEMEEVLSARAKGAIGGGLEEWMGGLKGLDWRETQNSTKLNKICTETFASNTENLAWTCPIALLVSQREKKGII